jgi:hypothetical protein
MSSDGFEVRSEARGSHWVAWVTKPGQSEQAAAILMVGLTREEAEQRMNSWWHARDPSSRQA